MAKSDKGKNSLKKIRKLKKLSPPPSFAQSNERTEYDSSLNSSEYESKLSQFDNGRRSKRPQWSNWQQIGTVNACFSKAEWYRSYRLEHEYTKYGQTTLMKICKISKRMNARMKSNAFKPLGSIPTISSLFNSKLAYNSIAIHEGTAEKRFHFFMNK